MKTCSKCKIEKDESEFHKRKDSKDGLCGRCRECRIKYNGQWNIENIDRKKKSNEQWNKNNLKRKKEIDARFRKNNPNYNNEYHKKRRANDPLFKLAGKIRSVVRTSITRGGYKKNSKTEKLLSCTFQELMSHLGPQPFPDYQLDHICPIAQAKTEKEICALQNFRNFQWLKREDNGPSGKWDSWTPEGEQLCLQLLGREWIYN